MQILEFFLAYITPRVPWVKKKQKKTAHSVQPVGRL